MKTLLILLLAFSLNANANPPKQAKLRTTVEITICYMYLYPIGKSGLVRLMTTCVLDKKGRPTKVIVKP